MTPADGERERMRHALGLVRGLLDGLESAMKADVPCTELACVVADNVVRLVGAAARLDMCIRTAVSPAR